MTIKDHFKITFRIALPVVLSQLGQDSVGVAESRMVGRLGAVELAAASLAKSSLCNDSYAADICSV